ncbi:MAG: hypothetical protein ABI399_11680 [Bauldia sp.]
MAYRFRHVFVISYGRSGSTVLNGLLNALPGTCVRGENFGSFVHLFRAIRAAELSRTRFGRPGSSSPTSPWYGAAGINGAAFGKAVIDSFIRDVLAPPADAELIGFKEIRYTRGQFSDDEFEDFLKFVEGAFDRPCFIFSVRRPGEVAKSAWWAGDPFARSEIASLNKRFRSAAERRPANAYVFEYDYIRKAPDSLHDLHGFLGASFDAQRVKAVLALPHALIGHAPVIRRVAGLPRRVARSLGRRLLRYAFPNRADA